MAQNKGSNNLNNLRSFGYLLNFLKMERRKKVKQNKISRAKEEITGKE
jgi:hypothetical protein